MVYEFCVGVNEDRLDPDLPGELITCAVALTTDMSSSQVGATFDAGRCALFAFDQVWRREEQSCCVDVAVLISADAKLCQLVDLGRLLDIANCE